MDQPQHGPVLPVDPQRSPVALRRVVRVAQGEDALPGAVPDEAGAREPGGGAAFAVSWTRCDIIPSGGTSMKVDWFVITNRERKKDSFGGDREFTFEMGVRLMF